MTRTAARGFSLTELLAALAITLLLLSVALPGYREHRHTAARLQALQSLQSAERCRASQSALAGDGASRPIHDCLPPDTAAYRFFLVPAEGGFGEGHDWRAEPRGDQRRDRCGTLVLDHLGRKSVLGTGEGGADCWRGR